MARLENTVSTLITLFKEYSDCDGYISKEDFKDMLDREISDSSVKAQVSEDTLDAFLNEMDSDKDGYYSIKEFTECVAYVTRQIYRVEGLL